MSDLRISRDLALPRDVVTQPIAILARRGAGKTYTASVLVEEVIRAKLPVVILDPTGAWWGLRSSVDGQKPGLPVVIFGGDHGDVPLDRASGRELANVVLEHPGAYVIDLSTFESRTAEQGFAGDFLERLYRGKKRETGPLLLVVDEADTFAPQRPGGEQLRTLGALEAIVRRGRIKGLGDLLITQRAAVLNKNVLTQTEVLVAMQTTGPQDRAAIDEWIAGNGTREERDEVLGSLASLERGEAWVWSPSFLRILKRIRIRERTTYDSSRTPGAGETAVAPRAFAKVDLEQLGERIRASVEQAKANDPAELRRRIRELEAAARSAADHSETIPERVVVVEVPVLNGQVGELRDVVRELAVVGDRLGDLGVRVLDRADAITAAIDRVATAPRPAPEHRAAATPVRATAQGRTGAPPAEPASGDSPRRAPSSSAGTAPLGAPLKAGARRMLSALARLHPTPLTRDQVALLAGVKKGGTFSDYLRSLTTGELAIEDRDGVVLTPAGEDLVRGELGAGAPSTAELVALYAPKLKAGARRMLELLVERYPGRLSRTELSELAEVTKGGTFSDYLRSLTRVGLAVEDAAGIQAGPDLFLEDAR